MRKRSKTDLVQAWLVHAQVIEKFRTLIILQLHDLGFQLVANGDHTCTFLPGDVSHRLQVRVILETLLVDIGDVHGRRGGFRG